LVNYESKILAVLNAKAWRPEFAIDSVIKAFHQNHIRVIGRIVCFSDPYLSVQKPEWEIKNKNGEPYITSDGETWLNPVNKEVWKYFS